MSLPKNYHQKYSSKEGSYSRDGDCDYLKGTEREKRTKYYLSISLVFLELGLGVTTNQLRDSEDISIPIRFRFRVSVTITRLTDTKDGKIYLGEVG